MLLSGANPVAPHTSPIMQHFTLLRCLRNHFLHLRRIVFLESRDEWMLLLGCQRAVPILHRFRLMKTPSLLRQHLNLTASLLCHGLLSDELEVGGCQSIETVIEARCIYFFVGQMLRRISHHLQIFVVALDEELA